jgi:hypothetical protein
MVQYDDCYIELLELFPCNSKEELCKREGELQRLHIDKLVSKRIEGRTRKELLQTNKYKDYWKTQIYRNFKKDNWIKYKENKKAKLINVNNATSIIPVNNISSNINIQESIIIPTTTIPDIDSLIIDIE